MPKEVVDCSYWSLFTSPCWLHYLCRQECWFGECDISWVFCRYAWVTAVLTHMYEQLGDCSYANTRKLVGYATFLQSWIYKYFRSIGMRRVQS